MSNTEIYFSLAHEGYMAGLNGSDPDESKSRSEEYSLCWLTGAEDREKGIKASKYLGPCKTPIRRGSEVVIPKGTKIRRGSEEHEAKRSYKVKLHDVYIGGPAYVDYHFSDPKVVRPTESRVLWAGSGSSWSEANLCEIMKDEACE